MKRLGIGCLLIFALATMAAAAPMLGVDPVTYDFGSVAEGTVVSHAFVVTNRGDATLTITGVRATCGCTTTALPKSALEPGESVSLEARVDTTHFGGRISKQVYIDSNDPTAPSAVVTIQGEVTPLQPHNITLGDLKYLFFLIIDIRSPDAYAACHLLGAMNIPSAQLPLWIDILPRDVILVVYDDAGSDSAAQAKYLQSVGFPQARSLAGGLAAWSLIPNAVSYVTGDFPTLLAPAPSALKSYEIGTGDLRSIYLLVIDVRTPGEYAARSGHFMGAINIPATELALWQEKLPRDVMIVLYDQTGQEADRQAQALQAGGLTKLRSLAGGYDAWVRSYGITFLIAERP